MLIRAGFHTVLHDEQRLAELLRQRLEEMDPRLTQAASSNRPPIFLTAERATGSMVVSASGRPGSSQLDSIGVLDHDPNLLRHLEEAQHY